MIHEAVVLRILYIDSLQSGKRLLAMRKSGFPDIDSENGHKNAQNITIPLPVRKRNLSIFLYKKIFMSQN